MVLCMHVIYRIATMEAEGLFEVRINVFINWLDNGLENTELIHRKSNNAPHSNSI